MRGTGMVLALAGHLLLALGMPLPASSGKTPSQPFPCQDRPCGCLDADECWKGDCCCFTLEQKVDWAEAHGIEPPPHVRQLVAARKAEAPPPCPECEKANRVQTAPVRWLVGAFVQKCRGEGPTWLPVCDMDMPRVSATAPVAPEAGNRVSLAVTHPHSHLSPPPAPPPRD